MISDLFDPYGLANLAESMMKQRSDVGMGMNHYFLVNRILKRGGENKQKNGCLVMFFPVEQREDIFL